MKEFDEIIQKFQSGEMEVERWNFCINKSGNTYKAYIMGEGSEQCLTNKEFTSEEEIRNLYKSLGINENWILYI